MCRADFLWFEKWSIPNEVQSTALRGLKCASRVCYTAAEVEDLGFPFNICSLRCYIIDWLLTRKKML